MAVAEKLVIEKKNRPGSLFRARRIPDPSSSFTRSGFAYDCIRPALPHSPQETHTLCVFDRLPVVSWRRAKYKQMYGLKSTLTVSR